MGRLFTAQAVNLTLATDAGDFLLLTGIAGTRAKIHEIRVWQDGTTSLIMDGLRFSRGSGGSGGGSVTEHDRDGGETAAIVVTSLPTTDVISIDYELHMGWNLLQEALWLPTPDQQLWLNDGDDLGIGRILTSATAHVSVSVSVTWEEFGS